MFDTCCIILIIYLLLASVMSSFAKLTAKVATSDLQQQLLRYDNLLQEWVETAQQHANEANSETLSDDSQKRGTLVSKIEGHKVDIDTYKATIQVSIDLLTKAQKEWGQYIDQLQDPAMKATEYSTYAEMMEGDNGMVKLILKAKRVIIVCQHYIDEAHHCVQYIHGSNDSKASNGSKENPSRTNSQDLLEHSPAFPDGGPQLNVNAAEFFPVTPTQPTMPISSPMLDISLPKFEMPKFDGDPTQWPTFWDHFRSAIHDKTNITDVLKLQYLKGFVTGKAAKSLSGITVTNQNYQEAIKLLQTRYGDPELIKESLWNKLHHMTTAKSQNLSDTLDDIEEVVRQLNALGENTEHPFLTQIVMQCIPSGAHSELEDKKPDESPWKMEALLQTLRHMVKKRARIEWYENPFRTPSANQRQDRKVHDQGYNQAIRKPGTSSYWTQGRNPQVSNYGMKTSPSRPFTKGKQPTGPCAFCQEFGHWNEHCTKYPLAVRKKRINMLKLCMKCLGTGHSREQCRTPGSCIHCGKPDHNRALCFHMGNKEREKGSDSRNPPVRAGSLEIESKQDTEAQDNTKQRKDVPEVPFKSAFCIGAKGDVVDTDTMFCLAKVSVRNPDDPKKTTMAQVFMDTGCGRTFIEESLAKKLGLVLKPDPINLKRLATTHVDPVKSGKGHIELFCKDGSIEKLQINTLEVLSDTVENPPLSQIDEEYLKEFPVDILAEPNLSVSKKQPAIVIGIDYFWKMLLLEKVKQLPSGLFLVPSKFGLMISGSSRAHLDEENKKQSIPMMKSVTGHLCTLQAETLMNVSVPELNLQMEPDKYVKRNANPSIEDWCSLEAIGIKDDPEINDADRALELFNSKIRINEEGRIEVGLPWKREPPDLPNNFGLAMGQLKSQLKKYKENPDLLLKVNQIMEDQQKMGIIEEVPHGSMVNGPVSYLPHHPVVTPQKDTTKVREVFNGSAKASKEQNSLNDCLYPGPVILADLVGMIFRSRFYETIIMADLEKAFLQISLRPEDRDCTRFLWFKDTNKPMIERNIKVFRFKRVLFGLNCSPFLLAGSIKTMLQCSKSPVAEMLKKNMYVDNALMGVSTTKEGIAIYTESKQIFKNVHMNLREFMSNDQTLMQKIPELDRAKSIKSKILGVPWNAETDELQIEPPSQKTSMKSKRTLLSIGASMFDPLGLLSPFILLIKIFIQHLWKTGKNWDEPLSEPQIKDWHVLQSDLKHMENIKIPRYLGVNSENQKLLELHVFTDASRKAYGLAAYVLIPLKKSTLVFSKTRLAPIKKILTLPRLELMALLLGVRAAKYLQQEAPFHFKSVTVWSDSQCCLHWIQSYKPLSVFVENRIKEIKSAPNISYRYVPTMDNPADLASRGLSLEELKSNSLWWEGPSWLKKDTSSWPQWDLQPTSEIQLLLEQEFKARSSKKTVQTKAGLVKHDLTMSEVFIDISRFSSLKRLQRVTVFCFRFLHKLLAKSKNVEKFKQNPNLELILNMKFPDEEKIITAEHIDVVHYYWLLNVQSTNFGAVLEAVKQKNPNPLKDTLGLHLNNQNLLQCHGRLAMSSLPNSSKYPILLPHKDYYTALMIMDNHKKNKHTGTAQTLASLRENYWIPKGRATVKKVLKNCSSCKRHQAVPFERPEMPPLQSERINPDRPFRHIGIDNFGPLYAKNQKELIKVWCTVFVLYTRAIHIEIATDLSTERFLGCLRKFIARRGFPSTIISDNAPSFRTTEKLISEVSNNHIWTDDTFDYCAHNGITWKFLPQFSPWMGGFYERLIGIVKTAIRKSLGRKILAVEELDVFMTEVESIVNSRPLTFLYSELNSRALLRPIDFILPLAHTGIPNMKEISDPNDPTHFENMSTKDKVIQLWSQLQTSLDKFWKFFIQEYVPSLRENQKLHHDDPRSVKKREPNLHEIVLMKDPQIP